MKAIVENKALINSAFIHEFSLAPYKLIKSEAGTYGSDLEVRLGTTWKKNYPMTTTNDTIISSRVVLPDYRINNLNIVLEVYSDASEYDYDESMLFNCTIDFLSTYYLENRSFNNKTDLYTYTNSVGNNLAKGIVGSISISIQGMHDLVVFDGSQDSTHWYSIFRDLWNILNNENSSSGMLPRPLSINFNGIYNAEDVDSSRINYSITNSVGGYCYGSI